MVEFLMPSLGADMTSGILTDWFVRPGQPVRRGDVVAVVETDKGAIEIEIFVDGVVAELLVAPDTEVEVGMPIARLDTDAATTTTDGPKAVEAGRAEPAEIEKAKPAGIERAKPAGIERAKPAGMEKAKPAAVEKLKPPETAKTQPMANTRAGRAESPGTSEAPGMAEPVKPGAPSGGRRKVSPAARKHAREQGIDLDQVVATGHGGVVTVEDVEQAASKRGGKPRPGAETDGPVDRVLTSGPTGSDVTMTPMRRAIASAMSRSKREIPHYYLAHTIDLETALAWLEQRNRERPLAGRLLAGVLLMKAAALAVADAPALNGHWLHDGAQMASRVDLGVIISLRGGGLAAPTLADVAGRGLDDLMAALRDVTARARAGRLRSSDLGMASLTISSLGDSAVETLYPVIHPPQLAIVGFGGIVTRPWVVNGGLHVRRVITATLAADHRASDGHVGARYLAALERILQKPEML